MRQPELNIKRARGFLLIVAILVLVVIAVAIAAMGNMTSADVRASSGHAQSEQAYFAAQSGLEFASFQYGSGTACGAGLTNTNVLVGNGTFSTTAQIYASSAATVSPAGLSASATSVAATVAGSTAVYAPHGRIRIDTEEIDYSINSGSGFSGLTRGVAGTSAAAHASGALMRQDLCWLRSAGIANSAERVLERTLHEASSMFVYAKTADNVPYFRIWDGAAWGAEQSANAMPAGGTTVEWMVLKFARTRNEALLGTLDTLGDIRLQIWNGFTWTNLNGGAALSNIGTTNDGFRGFDIEYETGSDRAIIVYNNANATSPYYRIWNGSNLSAAVALSSVGNLGAYPGGAAPIWIELAPNPLRGSNEIVLITESITANDSVYGARWNGTKWDDMGQGTAAVWDSTTGNGNDRKFIDVAYEQLSGNAMFLWADQASGAHQYRIWDGSTLSGAAALTIAAAGGNPEWVKLAHDPYSNQIMLGSQDSGSHLNTRLWSGSAWNGAAANPEHDNGVESRTERTFDIAFETHPSQTGSAWIVWGDALTVSQRKWSGGAWGGVTIVAGTDDTDIVHLRAHPTSGTLFSSWYESNAAAFGNRRILTRQLTSGSGAWSATTQQFRPSTIARPLQGRLFIATRKVIVIDTGEIYP